MGGEDQLKALIRQSFSLQNTADKAVLDVDRVLAQSMANVKRWVEQLPEESLLRAQAWKELEPFVRQELEVYSNQLGSSIENALIDAEPGMERAAIRQAQLAGADFGPEMINLNPPGGGVQKSVEMALNSRVNNVTVKRLFNLDGKGSGSVFDKALFKTVDTRVRAGMIQGLPTQEIANQMAQDVQRAGIPGVNLNAEAVKTIRSQSMAMARTATQDMARQVKDEVYDANADAMEGMEWQWSTALDSRTCEQCAPLDGQRWKDKKDVPQWPLHPNCRCQALPIDPEDPFWNEKSVNAQVIRPVEKGPYKGEGAYKTPIKINGKKFYRKSVTVTSDTPPPNYSDTLAYWAKNSQASLKEAMGPSRAAWFTKEYDRLNRDPQQILQAMLTGKPGAQKWIPVEQLNKKTVTLAKPKPKVKPKPKAAPKPKPVAKAATPTQAPKPKPTPKAAPKAAAPAPAPAPAPKPKTKTVAKAAKPAPAPALTGDEKILADANAQIKEISQKTLAGKKLTAADQDKLEKAVEAKRNVLDKQEAALKKAQKTSFKLQETTEDIDWEYNTKDFADYGYKSKAEMKKALSDVKKYTDDGYSDFEAAQLRGRKASALSAYEKDKLDAAKQRLGPKLDDLEASANTIEDFVAKAPKYDGEVSRGLSFGTEEEALAFVKELGKGNPSNTLQSWSNDYGIAQDFATKGRHGVIMNVQNKNGAPIAAASDFSAESEVLVPSKQRYRILKMQERTTKNASSGKPMTVLDIDLELID